MQMVKEVPHWERGDFNKLIDSLSKDSAKKRHDIRYALFRVKNQLDGGNPAEKDHWTIAEEIQDIPKAGSLKSFAESWDVARVFPEVQIVQRLWSVHQEHDQIIQRVAVAIEKSDTPESLAKKAAIMEKREARRFKKENKKRK